MLLYCCDCLVHTSQAGHLCEWAPGVHRPPQGDHQQVLWLPGECILWLTQYCTCQIYKDSRAETAELRLSSEEQAHATLRTDNFSTDLLSIGWVKLSSPYSKLACLKAAA